MDLLGSTPSFPPDDARNCAVWIGTGVKQHAQKSTFMNCLEDFPPIELKFAKSQKVIDNRLEVGPLHPFR